MARKPEVFVRPVTPEEGRKLQQITRTSKQPVRVRRAIVVLASAQGQPVPLICRLTQVSENYVRQVIRDFNDEGFAALDPKWSGGRPSKTDPATRERIGQIARCCPRDLGWPFSTWSLSKLRDVLRINQIADISRETLRKILKDQGISWQATKTWKAGKDPEFAVPRISAEPAGPLARPEAVCDRRQLLPAQARRGPRLVRQQRRRAGVLADLFVVVELDRVRVRGTALLCTQRHRPSQPQRAGRRDRRLHPLAQPARPTQTRLRREIQDPAARLPTVRCLTRH